MKTKQNTDPLLLLSFTSLYLCSCGPLQFLNRTTQESRFPSLLRKSEFSCSVLANTWLLGTLPNKVFWEKVQPASHHWSLLGILGSPLLSKGPWEDLEQFLVHISFRDTERKFDSRSLRQLPHEKEHHLFMWRIKPEVWMR
jgi:hypothetical protein